MFGMFNCTWDGFYDEPINDLYTQVSAANYVRQAGFEPATNQL